MGIIVVFRLTILYIFSVCNHLKSEVKEGKFAKFNYSENVCAIACDISSVLQRILRNDFLTHNMVCFVRNVDPKP